MKHIIVLNVYDDDDNIIKTAEAKPTSIRYGVVRKLMRLLKIENAKDTWDLLKIVSDAGDAVTSVLSKCFPEMTQEDWDNVKLEDLVSTVLAVTTSSFGKLSEIPRDEDEKN